VKLSIVTTLYRSAGTIEEFHRLIMQAAEAITAEIELVIVNDGSPDNSLELALSLREADPRITIVDLSRNFGHHKAMMTGLAYANGDLVFLIDSDLDEDPALLTLFYERFVRGDCDVVYGYQAQRRGGPFEKITGYMYYRLVELLSDDEVPRGVITARLMKRDYVKGLVRHRDRAFFIVQLWSTTGFCQVGLAVKKSPRAKPAYSLRKRAAYFVSHVTTSSTKLLYIIFYTGFLLSFVTSAVIAFFILRYLFWGISVSGFTSIIVSIWLFGGLITLILGILGLYIANILSETKRRPYTVIRSVYRASTRVSAVSDDISLTHEMRSVAGPS
jgi:putative glycosyltransferase